MAACTRISSLQDRFETRVNCQTTRCEWTVANLIGPTDQYAGTLKHTEALPHCLTGNVTASLSYCLAVTMPTASLSQCLLCHCLNAYCLTVSMPQCVLSYCLNAYCLTVSLPQCLNAYCLTASMRTVLLPQCVLSYCLNAYCLTASFCCCLTASHDLTGTTERFTQQTRLHRSPDANAHHLSRMSARCMSSLYKPPWIAAQRSLQSCRARNPCLT